MNTHLRSIYIYLSLLFSLGLVVIAITPPFENFDELAHFSAVRQIALDKKIPTRSEAFLEQILVDYYGPKPYSSGMPPFDSSLTYAKFFSEFEATKKYIDLYENQAMPLTFERSPSRNGEYEQHPTLYYLLMAPFLQLFVNTSLSSQILVLRLISLTVALLGVWFAIASLSINKNSANNDAYEFQLFGFFIYPFIFPMAILEFARIGNDSLCLLLLGIISYQYQKWKVDKNSVKWLILMGTTIGLGLWTKAFFLIILLAIACHVAMSAILLIRKNEKLLYIKIKELCCIVLPAILTGGWWYLYNYITVGSITGAKVILSLPSHVGFWWTLLENFDLLVFLRGMLVVPVTFIWGGTQSLAHFPLGAYLPLLFLALIIFVTFLIRLSELNFDDIYWQTFLLFLFFILALGLHAIVNIAAGGGNGNTPGWYLHILWPFSAPVLGLLVNQRLLNIRLRVLAVACSVYGFLFFIVANWYQVSLFYGCAEKGVDKSYMFSTKYLCLDSTSQIFQRIQILGYPWVALFSSIIAFILILIFYGQIRNWLTQNRLTYDAV